MRLLKLLTAKPNRPLGKNLAMLNARVTSCSMQVYTGDQNSVDEGTRTALVGAVLLENLMVMSTSEHRST